MRRSFALGLLACALVVAQQALAAGPPRPKGWGKAPPPPANGSGEISLKHGGAEVKLPLQKIEVTKLKSGLLMYSLLFVDASQQNKAVLAFGAQGPAPVKVADVQITGVLVQTTAGGSSKGSVGKTACNLTLSSLSDQGVTGTASCEPMFGLDNSTPARPMRDVRFDAKVK